MDGQHRQSRGLSNNNGCGSASTQSDLIVSAARKYIGVPYKNNGRSLQGIDCVGLLILVGRDLGVEISDHRYRDAPSQKELEKWLSVYCTVDANLVFEEGRILQINIPRAGAFHTGVLASIKGRESFIHAWDTQKRVLEPLLDSRWKKRVVATWKLNKCLGA